MSIRVYFAWYDMTIRVYFAWYDLWVGAYWDRDGRKLYVCPLPCVVFKFSRPSW